MVAYRLLDALIAILTERPYVTRENAIFAFASPASRFVTVDATFNAHFSVPFSFLASQKNAIEIKKRLTPNSLRLSSQYAGLYRNPI